MGGAVGDPPHGALIVFDVDSAAEVEEFAAADPYVLNGLVTARRVEPWAVVLAAVGRSSGMALEPVVGDRLPRRRVVDELAVARPHPRVAVEHAEAHAGGSVSPGARLNSADPHSPQNSLAKPVLGLPRLHSSSPADEADAARLERRVRRGGCAGAVLAARAVAVARVPSGSVISKRTPPQRQAPVRCSPMT